MHWEIILLTEILFSTYSLGSKKIPKKSNSLFFAPHKRKINFLSFLLTFTSQRETQICFFQKKKSS